MANISPLARTTFIVIFVPLPKYFHYSLNVFNCTNVVNRNRENKLTAKPKEARVFSSDVCCLRVINPDFL